MHYFPVNAAKYSILAFAEKIAMFFKSGGKVPAGSSFYRI
jgi:hypothetical protein